MNTDSVGVTSGGAIQILQMSAELARRGHQIDLIFTDDGDLRPDWETFCRSVHQIPRNTFSRKRAFRDAVSLIPGIWAAVQNRPDVVYVNSPQELAFGLCAGFAARAPVICHLHYEWAYPSFPRLAARAGRNIVVSRYLWEQYVEKGVAPSQLVVVHNGIALGDYPPAATVDRATARRRLELPENAFIALYFGRLDEVKGVDVLLRAWSKLALPPETARLLIVGSATLSPDPDAELRRLQTMAPPGCHWLPMQRDVVTPLHAADVVVVPSTWDESFGRTVVEGLAAGLPVVASRVGGIPEILDRELSRFLFERGSESELAEQLASLFNWREKHPDLGRECMAHAAQFGIGQMVDGIERVLQDCATNRTRTRRARSESVRNVP